MSEYLELIAYFGGLLQGFVLAAIWLAPDTPFWRGFRDVWSLRFIRRHPTHGGADG